MTDDLLTIRPPQLRRRSSVPFGRNTPIPPDCQVCGKNYPTKILKHTFIAEPGFYVDHRGRKQKCDACRGSGERAKQVKLKLKEFPQPE